MLRELISGKLDFGSIIVYILSSLTVIFLTLPVHEFAHGLAATKLGDPTPRYQGRMTVNPFAHIDWIGAACILLFGFGKLNAFPVDVWIRRIIEHYYFNGNEAGCDINEFAHERFGELGGFAQQYLFYYARENKIAK